MSDITLTATGSHLDSLPVSRWRAAAVAIGTSVLFFVCYGGAGWLTADRQDVATWYYSWERSIPFVTEMIVPYMSIDLFFFAAPFFCRSRSELRVLAWRLVLVIVLAATCFLIYPLKLAVERPIAEGVLGAVYNWFTAIDQAYNLCPSMHIALRTVLAAHYARYTRGRWKMLMHFWFFLIGCSTLLLYQHHVIDVVGGFVLAALVMYAVDGQAWRLSKPGNWTMASRYAAIALGLLLPVIWEPKLGWLTIWPATSCLLVAAGYAWIGPAIFRRRDGRIAWPAKWVLGPVLAAHWLSWKYYATRSNRWDEVADGICIGRSLTEREANEAVAHGMVAVVDVCSELDEPVSLRSLPRLELPVLDLTAPSPNQLDDAVAFLQSQSRTLKQGQRILVHCKAGYSRSVGIVAAWLLRSGRVDSVEEAFRLLRRARPGLVIRPEIHSALQSPSPSELVPSESSRCHPSTI